MAKYQSLDTQIAAAKQELADGVGLAPVGSIVAWPAGTLPPPNWKRCNGQSLPAKNHKRLAAVLDTTYGSDGLDKVKLPDFSGKFLRGHDQSGSPLGQGQPASHRDLMMHVSTYPTGDYGRFNYSSERIESVSTFQLPTNLRSGAEVNGQRAEGFVKDNLRGVLVSASPGSATTHRVLRLGFSGGPTRPAHFDIHWIIRVK